MRCSQRCPTGLGTRPLISGRHSRTGTGARCFRFKGNGDRMDETRDGSNRQVCTPGVLRRSASLRHSQPERGAQVTSDLSDLAESWQMWTGRAGMADATVGVGEDGEGALFRSDDEAYELRHANGWWVLDEIDDRGRRYTDTARFSTIALAHEYLVWRWSSIARTALGAKQLGPYFHSLGMNPNVDAVCPCRSCELRGVAPSGWRGTPTDLQRCDVQSDSRVADE